MLKYKLNLKWGKDLNKIRLFMGTNEYVRFIENITAVRLFCYFLPSFSISAK